MTGRHLILTLLLIFTLSSSASAAGLNVIVQLSPSSSLSAVLSFLDGVLLDTIPGANIHLIEVPHLPLVQSSLPLLGVHWLEVNSGVQLFPIGQLGVLQLNLGGPVDWYKGQPAMQRIRSQEALTSATGRSIVVADINSQTDYSHPALIGHLTSGYDFVAAQSGTAGLNQSSSSFLDQSSSSFLDQSSSSFLEQSSSSFLDELPLLGSQPAYSHGTLCAGLIAVVAPDAMIMPLRAFDENGNSDLFTLSKAVRYAVTNGAQVINMSFGTLTDSRALRDAITFAKAHNVTLVASAGNNDTPSLQYPAAYTGVTSVSALNLQDVKGSFSNYGTHVDLAAPGVNVISAYPGGLYSMVSGTSFSAPIVAGTAALVRSMGTTSITPISNAAINIDSQNPNYVGKLGVGRVDVLGAVTPQ